MVLSTISGASKGLRSVSGVAVVPLVPRPSRHHVVLAAHPLIIGRMHVSCTLRREEHLNPNHNKDGYHGDQARHSRVAATPDVRKAWIRQRFEGGGQKMHESGGNEHAGAEVAREEEEVMRYGYLRDALDDDGEGACWCLSAKEVAMQQEMQLTSSAKGQDEDQGEDMERCIVRAPSAFGAAFRSWAIVGRLSPPKLIVEQLRGDIGP